MRPLLKRIKDFRSEAIKLTQRKLSLLLGFKKTTVADLERGKVKLTIGLLTRYILNFRLNPFWLIFGKGPMQISESFHATLEAAMAKQLEVQFFNAEDDISLDALSEHNLLIPIEHHRSYIESIKAGKWDARTLGSISIVKIPKTGGILRTFEIENDRMSPILLQGDQVCCDLIEDSTTIQEELFCIVVSFTHGIMPARTCFDAENSAFSLTFDNVRFNKPLSIPQTDVLELWEIKRRITTMSNDNTQPAINELLSEIKALRKYVEENKR